MLNFINAEAKHTELLRDVLITSKGYWGYSQEQLEKWRSNLKFEEEYITRNTVKLILKDKEVIGFFAIVKGDSDVLAVHFHNSCLGCDDFVFALRRRWKEV